MAHTNAVQQNNETINAVPIWSPAVNAVLELNSFDHNNKIIIIIIVIQTLVIFTMPAAVMSNSPAVLQIRSRVAERKADLCGTIRAFCR